MSARPRSAGFTLVEMMVSLLILTFILTVIFNVTSQTSAVWKSSTAKVEGFQSARLAFETITRALSHATLNTYYDYYNKAYQSRTQLAAASGGVGLDSFAPYTYGRNSDLEFVSGKTLVAAPHNQITHSVFFQTPAGYTSETVNFGSLGKLLNSVGFYLDFDSNAGDRPPFLDGVANAPLPRYRFRLMEFLQSTENLSVYNTNFQDPSHSHDWFSTSTTITNNSFLLAENVLALIVMPRLPTDPPNASTLMPNKDYEYDSQVTWGGGTQPVVMNQLPPLVHVVLIAADEASMSRIQGAGAAQPDSTKLGFNYGEVFQSCSGDETSTQLDADLANVSAGLAKAHINFRIYATDVAIQGAKWNN